MNNPKKSVKQFLLSPVAGKRLIAKSMLYIPSIIDALENRTVVIIAGTTNSYVAEEFLKKIGRCEDFSKKRFFRGITLPPGHVTSDTGRLSDESGFPGDVVIVNGTWKKGKTIFDVADNLKKDDVVIKGANAVNLKDMQAAVLIGHPKAGTIIPVIQSALGLRVQLYIPVGLEKRIPGDINKIAHLLNSSNAEGLRYMPVTGNIITELQAISFISGAEVELVACGGVCGAEGSCWIAVSGDEKQLALTSELITSIKAEPNFTI